LAHGRCILAEHGDIAAEARCLQSACSRESSKARSARHTALRTGRGAHWAGNADATRNFGVREPPPRVVCRCVRSQPVCSQGVSGCPEHSKLCKIMVRNAPACVHGPPKQIVSLLPSTSSTRWGELAPPHRTWPRGLAQARRRSELRVRRGRLANRSIVSRAESVASAEVALRIAFDLTM
jgi:hypothetical protein